MLTESKLLILWFTFKGSLLIGIIIYSIIIFRANRREQRFRNNSEGD